MREINIKIPKEFPAASVLRATESVLEQSGLQFVSRGSLKTLPGSSHWHLTSGNERGTLELTWWPAKRKLWLKIQDGRRGDWIPDAVARLKQKLAAAMQIRR